MSWKIFLSENDFNECMKKITSKTYIPHKKSICDWSDKREIFDSLKDVKVYC